MRTLTVPLPGREYDILIRPGLLPQAGGYICSVVPQARKVALVTDSHVAPLYGEMVAHSLARAGFQVETFVVPAGEQSKCSKQLARLWSSFAQFGLTRTDCVVALGGGVVGDLAGFAAATILRGVALIQIPTTLLAQVDSSVGGKVAIDLPEGKNLAGTFYQPRLVLIDPDTLSTLPSHFFADGMGEVIKYGCIRRPALFNRLLHEDVQEHLEEVIYECVDCKRQVVEADALDKGERMILNFGHTLGHALEKLHGFSGLSHGEAVGIGMVLISKAGERAGLTAPGTSEKIAALLEKYHLPTKTDWSMEQIAEATALDKKSVGKNLRLILLHDIGDAYIYTLPRENLQEFLK